MAGEDPDYIARVKALKCAARGMPDHVCKGPIQAHHAGSRVGRPITKGGDRRAHDRTAIPLCLQAHAELHDSAGPFKDYRKAAKRAWQDQKIAETQAALAEPLMPGDAGPVFTPPPGYSTGPVMKVGPEGATIDGEPISRAHAVAILGAPVVDQAMGPPSPVRSIPAYMLPIAYHCGLSVKLSREHRTESVYTAAGHAYEAIVQGDPKAPDLLQALTPDERERVEAMPRPELPPNVEHQIQFALDATGRSVPYDSPARITRGRADMRWVEGDTVHVPDIKAGNTWVDPETLQVAAAGFAFADELKLPNMRLGIWRAQDGRFLWSDVIPVDSERAAELWRRILVAVGRKEIAGPGAHCSDCFQRGVCPERLLPAMAATTAPELAPFTSGGPALTAENAPQAIMVLDAMEDLVKRGWEQIEAAVAAGMVIEANGKVWRPSICQGRERADVAALRRDGLTDYIARGAPYQRWGWRRP